VPPPQKKKIVRTLSAPLSTIFATIKANFEPPLKKNCKKAQVPGGESASKTWSFYDACKNLGTQPPLGAEIVFRKVDLGGYDFTA